MQSSIGQDDWLGWARQLTGAVAALHTLGFVHSDIKPHNVLVARDGTLRLSDLSSATATAPAGATATAAAASDGSAPYRSPAVGTAAYSAPELLQLPPRPATPAADIYSLGVTFYVVGCTARDPFHGVKSTVERMVLAMRGMFWEWESANPTTPIARRRGLAPKTPSLPAMSSTFAPSQPVSQTPPPAPPPRFNLPSAASSNSSAGSRTSALGRSQTITSPPLSSVRSRPSAALQIDTSVSSSPSLDGKSTLDIPHDPALALYYLDGSPVPQPLACLLRSMVALSPADRPSPFDVMAALRSSSGCLAVPSAVLGLLDVDIAEEQSDISAELWRCRIDGWGRCSPPRNAQVDQDADCQLCAAVVPRYIGARQPGTFGA
ncbi:kinase-like protein [Ramicandelaber brevisporus]|nr:kinase-like protein [Ramicandelaber brevisporus]